MEKPIRPVSVGKIHMAEEPVVSLTDVKQEDKESDFSATLFVLRATAAQGLIVIKIA
jgi:hypothetical protein